MWLLTATLVNNMREIKFRAWDRDGWIKFDLEDLATDTVISRNFPTFEHITQFTGLHDKNGKEMYEGDIIQREIKFEGKEKPKKQSFKIKWNQEFAEFQPISVNGWTPILRYILDGDKTEIIGNIYENPELLK